MSAIRVGIMGFGRVGRELYRLASTSDDVEIVAVVDLAGADVLEYLLNQEQPTERPSKLTGNWLIGEKWRTRMLQISHPHEVPWDMLNTQFVLEATGRYRRAVNLREHLANGAERVFLSTLPEDTVERMLIRGINDEDAAAGDTLICAGSGTTAAFALMVSVLDEAFGIEHASMTTIHAFTSDQPAQDYAATDCRRSRSAAKNIIPNVSDSPHWVAEVMPHLKGKLSGYALNVPVQKGSLLDVTAVLEGAGVTPKKVNDAFRAAASRHPQLIKVAEDPIVSSDVIEETCSVMIDAHATQLANPRMIKTLGWYDARGHAASLLDVIRLYGGFTPEVRS